MIALAPAIATAAGTAAEGDGSTGHIGQEALPDGWFGREDPLEPLNRLTFSVNRQLWGWLDAIRGALPASAPSANLHEAGVHHPFWHGFVNVMQNLDEPVTFTSNVLMMDLEAASESLARFAINTTVGVGGIWDVASEQGWSHEPQDLGDVLCYYEVPEGPYIEFLFIGGRSARDAAGYFGTVAAMYSVLDSYYLFYRGGRIIARIADDAPKRKAAAIADAPDLYVAHRQAMMERSIEKCALIIE